MRGSAEATPADQAIYLRRLTNALNGEGYSYFVIEAFDQPWKVSAEGSVGAYWGVYNADRKAKFNFTGPVVPIPKWRALAIVSAVLAVLAFTLLLIDSSSLRQRGRTFLAVVSFACASVLVWIAYDYSQQYSTWFSLTVGALLGVGALGWSSCCSPRPTSWPRRSGRASGAGHSCRSPPRRPIGPRCRSTCPATTSRRNC